MTHFGVLCPALTGHLNTLLPLGQALQKRGHRVTLVSLLDAEPPTRAAGLEFRPIGEAERPAGAMARLTAQASTLSGRAALRYTVAVFQQDAALLLREAPAVLKAAGVEMLLVDQTSRGGGAVADCRLCTPIRTAPAGSTDDHPRRYEHHLRILK